MATELIDDLARVAHELWRARMQREGWRPGPSFDCATKVHDALVPYAQLSKADRRQAELALECEGMPERMARIIEYPRGPTRPFIIEEMTVGREVILEGTPSPRGRVESWEVDERGELTMVLVRWPDGTLVAYSPEERVLRRPEEG